jgi:hypothetical protein
VPIKPLATQKRHQSATASLGKHYSAGKVLRHWYSEHFTQKNGEGLILKLIPAISVWQSEKPMDGGRPFIYYLHIYTGFLHLALEQ